MASVGPSARKAILGQTPRIIRQVENLKKPSKPPAMPEWLLQAEKGTDATAVGQQPSEAAKARAAAQSAAEEKKKRVDGVRYNLWIGTSLPLYSSSDDETKLRNMHEPNHRELAISKYAARVADLLWPRVQDDVDEAIAKSKEMQAKKRIGVEEVEEYVPPEVPHLLPFTSWIRNSKEMRESFICDETTRYKPRMAWYNPNDGMIPSDWFREGLMADLAYYKPFTGLRAACQKW